MQKNHIYDQSSLKILVNNELQIRRYLASMLGSALIICHKIIGLATLVRSVCLMSYIHNGITYRVLWTLWKTLTKHSICRAVGILRHFSKLSLSFLMNSLLIVKKWFYIILAWSQVGLFLKLINICKVIYKFLIK